MITTYEQCNPRHSYAILQNNKLTLFDGVLYTEETYRCTECGAGLTIFLEGQA